MKIFCSFATICCLAFPASAVLNSAKDQFHLEKKYLGNAMWIFQSSGVYIYSPDGKTEKKFVPPEQVCPSDEPAYSGTGYNPSCRFYDIVSDGKKHVWAAVGRSASKIKVLDINTGAVLGAFETCKSPNKLEYHPLRDEVWVRCGDMADNSTEITILDVFSASSPSVNIQTDILVKEGMEGEGLSSRGLSVIDDTLGDIGYVTDRDLPYLFKIDLSEKTVIDKLEMTPASHGLYETAYSEVNKHAFVRSQVCCTCGFEGADLGDSCGRYSGSNVTVTTGTFAGRSDVIGLCGSSCEGVEGVDTIGVYEFDSVTETVVGTHVMKEGTGGDPYPSPDGKYIVLLAANGGKTVRILEAGNPSEASTVFADLELDFDRTGYEAKSVFRDFAFINKNGMTKIIIASGTEHKVAFVDISQNGAIETSYLTFSDDEFVNTAPHGRYRQVEWAIGTDFVWINDSSLQETFVINVMTEEVVTVISGLGSSRMLAVQNYDRARQHNEQKQLIEESMKQLLGSDGSTASAINSGSSEDDNGTDTILVVALVLGAVSLVVGAANLSLIAKMRKEINKPMNVGDDDDKSTVSGLNSVN